MNMVVLQFPLVVGLAWAAASTPLEHPNAVLEVRNASPVHASPAKLGQFNKPQRRPAAARQVGAAKQPTPNSSRTTEESNSSIIEKRESGQRQLALGATYFEAGAWDEAIAAFSKAADAGDPAVASDARSGLLRALSAKKEKRESGQRQLAVGATFLEAGAWDEAIAAFSKVADAEDPAVAADARSGLLRALNAKNGGALGLRAELPTPFSRWWVLDYLAYGLIAIVLAAIFIPIIAVAQRIFSRPVFGLFKRDRSKSSWRVAVSGSAQEPFRSLVFDEFAVTMRGLREGDQTVRTLSSVGLSEARFFAPLPLADLVGPGLVIQGVDVSQIAAILQRFRDYFSYGFDLRVDTVDSHAYVYASLRWGGRLERSWQIPSLTERQIPSLAESDQFDYREIGRQLAFTIYGDGLIRG